jgi:hypothetical protein
LVHCPPVDCWVIRATAVACPSRGRCARMHSSAARRPVTGCPWPTVRWGTDSPNLVRREGGKGLNDAPGQGAEGAGVAWGEPEHLLAEPAGVIELETELADGREQVLKLRECCRADCLGRHERAEHRDMGRDAEPGIGIEAFPVPRHGRFGLRDLNDQAAVGTRGCHGRTLIR